MEVWKNIPYFSKYQISSYGNIIKEYKSIIDASKETNIPKESITSCCNEKQVQTNGFTFRFEENKNKQT